MNWKPFKLGDLGEFRNGLNYSKENEGQGLKVISVKNFGDLRVPKYDELDEINPDGVNTKESRLAAGDIIFVRSNGNKELIGRSMYIENTMPDVSYSGFCIRFRNRSESARSKFLAYYFRSPLFRRKLSSLGGGTNINNLNQTVLKGFEVSVPSPQEQEKIVEVISTYDDLIENNRRRIALLEEAARLLYREWFVHFRFPGHEHVKIIDGVPEGWEIKKVGGLLARIKAKTKVRRDEYLEEGDYPCVDQGQNFIGGYTNNSDAIYRDELPLIVFGDHTRALKFIDFPFARGADGTQVCKSNYERLSQELFYWSLVNLDLSNYFYARHFKFLKDQEIIIPNHALADDFTRFARDNFKQIRALRQQCADLAKARDLLLPRLMDGRLEV